MYIYIYTMYIWWPFQDLIHWRYLPYVRPIQGSNFREYPHKIWPYIVQYPHLKFPLIFAILIFFEAVGRTWHYWIEQRNIYKKNTNRIYWIYVYTYIYIYILFNWQRTRSTKQLQKTPGLIEDGRIPDPNDDVTLLDLCSLAPTHTAMPRPRGNPFWTCSDPLVNVEPIDWATKSWTVQMWISWILGSRKNTLVKNINNQKKISSRPQTQWWDPRAFFQTCFERYRTTAQGLNRLTPHSQ